ncbi:hypothetical protein ES705_28125 [subsurface metagenome]
MAIYDKKMRIGRRARKPEILLSVTKNECGYICLEPTKILNRSEYEVFDSKGHGSQDEAIYLREIGVGLTQDELRNLVIIIDRDLNERFRGWSREFRRDYKKELRRIRKFLVKDKELLNQEKG